MVVLLCGSRCGPEQTLEIRLFSRRNMLETLVENIAVVLSTSPLLPG
jgi:hypothetical protein